ncbi:hypothetical protein BC831DRAFT_478007 [Entophlyctis helioformis]|nr:hypothetical protein BC831DRAFT_478007 [Entophlyctis helioformis]
MPAPVDNARFKSRWASPRDVAHAKAAIRLQLDQDTLLEAADTGNALESMWRLHTSQRVLDDLDAHDSARLAHLGVLADEWRHLVHSDLERHASPFVQSAFEKRTRDAILAKCHDLVRLVHGGDQTLAVTPAMVQDAPHKVAALLADTEQLRLQTLWQYVQVLDAYQAALADQEAAMHTLPAKHAAFATYMDTVLTNTRLKIECLQLDLLSAIDQSPMASDICLARDALVHANAQISAQARHLRSELSKYGNLGSEFQSIVDTYARLLEEMGVIQSDIKRLHK